MKVEDVFDLNELNVKKFLKYCKARPEDPKEDLMSVHAYLDEEGNINPRTQLYFSKKRYREQDLRIWTMLGQLKAIHEEKELLDLIDLSTKYDGTRWTEDPNCALFLFWLGNAGTYFDSLKKFPDGAYRTYLGDAKLPIWDWESPNDPNLQKRFAEYDEEVKNHDLDELINLRLFKGATRKTAEGILYDTKAVIQFLSHDYK